MGRNLLQYFTIKKLVIIVSVIINAINDIPNRCTTKRIRDFGYNPDTHDEINVYTTQKI